MKISRSPISPGEVLAGKYRIDGEVGAGSMGVVVQAWHLGLEQPVAVKFLYPEFARNKGGTERFRREARAAAKIRSEHVVQVLDVGNYGASATPYIVMELLEGRDLAAELKACGLVPWQEAVRFILEACEAIGEAHTQGIVHRDLKPANLFLHRRANHPPTVKVLDFGISKTASLSNTQLSLTDTSTLMGSPAYMSPEQLESSRDVDGRADIWSLGVILHEMLLGEIPFKGTSVPQLVRSILAGKRTSVAARNKALAPLEEVVAKCLAQRPDRRYADVGKLCQALRRCAKLPEARRPKRKSGFLFRATAGLHRPASATPRARSGAASPNPRTTPATTGSTPTSGASADQPSQGSPHGAPPQTAPPASIPEPFAPVSSERDSLLGRGPAPAAELAAHASNTVPPEGVLANPPADGSPLALPAATAGRSAPGEAVGGPLPAPWTAGSSAAAWGHTHNQRSSAWSRRGALGLALATLGGSITYEYFAQLEAEPQSTKTSALGGATGSRPLQANRPLSFRPDTSPSRTHTSLSSLTAALEPETATAPPEPKISLVLEPEPLAAEAKLPSGLSQNPSAPDPGPQPGKGSLPTGGNLAPPLAPNAESRALAPAPSQPVVAPRGGENVPVRPAAPQEERMPAPPPQSPAAPSPSTLAGAPGKLAPSPPVAGPAPEAPRGPAPGPSLPLSDFGGRK